MLGVGRCGTTKIVRLRPAMTRGAIRSRRSWKNYRPAPTLPSRTAASIVDVALDETLSFVQAYGHDFSKSFDTHCPK